MTGDPWYVYVRDNGIVHEDSAYQRMDLIGPYSQIEAENITFELKKLEISKK